MAHTVFISYSSHDRSTAEKVCAVLEGGGVKCWVSWRDIPPGVDWESSLLKAVTGSRVVVVIWTAKANESDDVALELKHAFRSKVSVIPFRLEAVAPNESLQYRMEYVQWLDATTPPVEKHLPRLIESVRADIERQVKKEEVRARAEQEARARAEREELERTDKEVAMRVRVEAAMRAEEEARQRERIEAWHRTIKNAERVSARRRRSLDKLRDFPSYTTEAIVLDSSPFVGQTLAEMRLNEIFNLTVMGVYSGHWYCPPGWGGVVKAGDVLMLQARAEDILAIIPEAGLQLMPAFEYLHPEFEADIEFFKAIVSRGSELNGRTIRSLNFRDRYDLTILAVSRPGVSLLGRLSMTMLRFGDTLLLAGERERFEKMVEDGNLSFVAEAVSHRFGGGVRRNSLLGAISSYFYDLYDLFRRH
jgi:Trk K+ transport system NAD-binding subunit